MVRILRDAVRDHGADPRVLNAVPGKGGVFGLTLGLQREFGIARCFNAPLAEATGWSFLAPYVFNCNAPDSGNAEVLLRYYRGSDAQ